MWSEQQHDTKVYPGNRKGDILLYNGNQSRHHHRIHAGTEPRGGGGQEGGEAQSTDELLSEYADRRRRAERLRQAIQETDAPGMQQYYQDHPDIEEDILDDITQETLNAGVTQETLDDLDDDAIAAAANDPIDSESGTAQRNQVSLIVIGAACVDSSFLRSEIAHGEHTESTPSGRSWSIGFVVAMAAAAQA